MRTGPDFIQFYPTIRCNKTCDFCFNRSMPDMEDMPLHAFESMLLILKQASVKTIDIIGGEPTLHREIAAMVRMAKDGGVSVNISSNGSNLDMLGTLMDLGPQVTAGISINDHETLAQSAAFIRAKKPVVKTVFSPALDITLVRSIIALKPKRFFLIFRDVLDNKELQESVPFHRFMTAVNGEFASSQTGMVFCSGFIAPEQDNRDLDNVRCPAGTTKLGILPDGSVYPCNLLFGRKEFLLGNIVTDDFERIWNNRGLAFFRARADNRCSRSSCALHARCHGGCPAQSFLLTGDLTTPDPRCMSR
jgi:radical SAM protein with 4Fe4S-binding SPASM domain